MAARLLRDHPHRSVAVLEARGATGGTWDLFRYPGVRSDSDMHTLGYADRPWRGPRAIADGASILAYLRETAAETGVDRRVRLHHRVVAAAWSSADARWTLTVARGDTGDELRLTCSWLAACTGYYRYDAGYAPAFPGREAFRGDVVHPQHWPQDLEVAGRDVVVVGSGATAVTLVPALAARGARVTMLQRSPSWVLALPSDDPLARRLRRALPGPVVRPVVLWKNVLLSRALYRASRRRPQRVAALLQRRAAAQLPPGYDVATHFTPSYDPWDQRLCVVPDGDLFRVVREGRAEVVTDAVERFVTDGIALASGRTLPADVVVTATGLELLALGGLRLVVDGEEVDPARTLAYKGLMLGGVPNLSLTVGYTNASWTLKADLVATYVSRLLRHLDRTGHRSVVPVAPDLPEEDLVPLIDLRSGYVLRGAGRLPRQGPAAPWRLHQDYLRDLRLLRWGPLTDGVRFDAPAPGRAA
ncbi:NAD(P)/FAD-dependent oxidoreductase [Vallicoccus soli]|uniref:NAD(P)/FAD-dependent oxidoreductase n=2 Tax=Vallicoccus soli TaxID=2339232 RepID=A0A3A3Z222_9ACTN|nr:NAD(P)/FAD-dependent oxidoreductase [Vallicoccus soli]